MYLLSGRGAGKVIVVVHAGVDAVLMLPGLSSVVGEDVVSVCVVLMG